MAFSSRNRHQRKAIFERFVKNYQQLFQSHLPKILIETAAMIYRNYEKNEAKGKSVSCISLVLQ